MNINSEINKEITKRGLKIYGTNNRKLINNFDTIDLSKSIFTFLSNNSFYRMLFNIMYKEMPMNADEALELLNEDILKESFDYSPLRNLYCSSCDELIDFYNPYLSNKPDRNITCLKCHFVNSLNECNEEDDWLISYPQIYQFLDELTENKLLSSTYFRYCRDHQDAKDFEIMSYDEINKLNKKELQKYIKSFYCNKCNNLYYIDRLYDCNQIFLDFYKKDGVWLEWYVKNLLLSNEHIQDIEYGVTIIDQDGIPFEIDALVLCDDVLYCFECKAVQANNKLDVPDIGTILQWTNFSDEIILVTTGKLKDRVKKILNRESIKYYSGLDIEKISKLL